jgi:NADH:ubiquinone oxidoreductase subunit 6 (subunit J)
MTIFVLILLVVFSILAVFLRDLLKSALSLAAASICLAIIFFMLHAFYAGVFEISVVAGLIIVLFVATISLTKSETPIKEGLMAYFLFPIFFILLIGIDLMIYTRFSAGIQAVPGVIMHGKFGEVLWGKRSFDLVGQLCVIFAGVFAIVSLFRGKNE